MPALPLRNREAAVADHLSSDLIEQLRKSGSETRESIAASRASIQEAREAMAKADQMLAGQRLSQQVPKVATTR